MPDHKHSLETTLELRRNGKLVRYLASSTFGPVVRPVIGDSKTQSVLVGLYPPSGSWDSGKVKAFAGRKTRGSLSGSAPKTFLFPVAQSGVAWGEAVYDEQKKVLLMVIGGVKHRNVIWPSPQRDDYALYLKVKKIYFDFSKNGS